MILVLLLCTTLLNARTKETVTWHEIDTLIAHGHYTSAYTKSGRLYDKAKRKGNSHDMLKALYKQRTAAAAYQEEHEEGSRAAYKEIIPLLKGADKSVAHLLLAALVDDKRPHYEAALAESEALMAIHTEDYDLLSEGDSIGLRLRPTLYDVVVHAITEHIYLTGNRERRALWGREQELMGTAEEFASLTLPHDTASYALWQLKQLQALTSHHLHTADAAVRAHIDRKRMETVSALVRAAALEEEYAEALEHMAESYQHSPNEAAMFMYLMAEHYTPHIYAYTDSTKVAQELAKAQRMEEYIGRIEQVAPDSKWHDMAQQLRQHVTHPYMTLQDHAVMLPEQEQPIMLTLRNAGDICYRIVPRYAGEHCESFNYKEVIGRRSVGKAYYRASYDMPNPYVYTAIPLTLPPLQPGDYFVIATNNGQSADTKRSSITSISVSNLKLAMLLNEAEGEYIGMTIDATTGKAVTDCELTLMEGSGMDTRFVASYTPDEKGYFTIPLPEGSYRNLYLRASDGASYTTYHFPYADFDGHRYWQRSEEESKVLFTFLPDRYTYEPGDTIHFAIIAYSHSEEGSSVVGQLPISIKLTDTRHKEVGTLQGRTDEWGHYHGCFALPEDVVPGMFRLEATNEHTGNSMYHTVKVEAFKAPTFTATMERPMGAIHFGDSLTLQGIATAYTGMPVTGAAVRYTVTVSNRNLFGYRQPYETVGNIVSGTTTTDEKGVFCMPIKINPLDFPHEDATYNYTIEAYVTDISGETQEAQATFVVGERTKYASFTDWSSTHLHGDSIGYSLRTLNGQHIAEQVTLRLSRLRVPHHTGIRASVENDWEQWQEECVYATYTTLTSDEHNSYMTIADDMPCGVYRLSVTYTDGGKEYSEQCHFELYGEGKGTVSSYALYTTTGGTREVATGDTAVVYVGTRHSEVYTHYYIKVQDRVVGMGTLCLTDETKALRIPIQEGWSGMMSVEFVAVKQGVKRIAWQTYLISDKSVQLQLHLSTLRDALAPGDKEQCTISVKDYWGRPVQTALVLSIYDAALDAYGGNYWDIALAPQRGGRRVVMNEQYQSAWDNNTYVGMPYDKEPKYYMLPSRSARGEIFYSLKAPATTRGLAKNRAGFDTATTQDAVAMEEAATMEETDKATEGHETYIRQDLKHTALFIPHLLTDGEGRATFTFTAPDLLTRWHIKGMAYSAELKHGRASVDFVTRKELMVQPNVPRFLYEGDVCHFTAKVTNSSQEASETVVCLHINGQTLCDTIYLHAGASHAVSFPFAVPTGSTSLTYRITAQGQTHRDGEQGTIRVLPRRTLATETMALYANAGEKREFVFEALKEHRSTTLEHHSLSLDVVSNPIRYVLEALPPLCKEDNPTNEQLFHRYYAATLARHLLDRYPEIGTDSLLAPFYQVDSLAHVQQKWLGELAKRQGSDGGWAWTEGFDSDRYTTLLIIKGIGELEAMGCLSVATNDKLQTMTQKGIAYLDNTYYNLYEQMSRKPKSLDSYALHYLYTRCLYPEYAFADGTQAAYEHYKSLLLKEKATKGTLMQKALKMLTLLRMGQTDKAGKIAKVVTEASLTSDEMGTYWRDNRYGYGWDTHPIATQALLIEAFTQLKQPADIVGRMQQWLLKQKQTTHWGSSIATAQAVYALVGTSVSIGCPTECGNTIVKVAGEQLPDKTAGLVQKTWCSNAIAPSLATVALEQQGSTPIWGSMTWQYYEEADKVKASGTGLTLTTTYYKVKRGSQGEELERINANTVLNKGDRIRIRSEFTTDRTMDYVTLHLHRPAALEPISTHSGYTFHRTIPHYRSVENTRTVCYFYRLNKGRYAIEHDLWVSQSGSYLCAPSTIECMYAPAFTATAEGTTIKVRE